MNSILLKFHNSPVSAKFFEKKSKFFTLEFTIHDAFSGVLWLK